MADFGDFYANRKDTVFRTVLAATGDRVGTEDAVAEAFTRACARWGRLRGHPNPVGWVVLTALNAHRSWWRRLRRELLHHDPPDRPAASGGADDGLSERMQAAVARLPRRQREVLALHVLADLPATEVGELLGLASATVHVHMHRALAALRRELNPVLSDRTTTNEVTR